MLLSAQAWPDNTWAPVPRWIHVQGWLRKFFASIQLSILGTATVALFLISLVPYSYMEPGIHGRLWTGARRLFSLWSIYSFILYTSPSPRDKRQ